MHGAGNDFVLMDDRDLTFPVDDHDLIALLCHRRTGVGADGLLLIQPSKTADFRMRYFNADGGEIDMCGNGARCIARLAHDIGAAPASMSFDTMAGLIRAEMVGDQVRLQMTPPHDWRMGQTIEIDGVRYNYDFVNSGVEHVVIEVPDVDDVDLQSLGSAIRYHEDFAPRGTNVNVVTITGPSDIRIRTYERGVEAETLACGTGMVAAGLLAGRNRRVTSPVRLTCAGGDVLEIGYNLTDDSAADVTLLGPAVYVFRGEIGSH